MAWTRPPATIPATRTTKPDAALLLAPLEPVEHAFVGCSDTTIKLADLPPQLREQTEQTPGTRPPASHLGPLETAEAAAIRDALSRHGGNRTRAAKELGVSRNSCGAR